MPQAKSAKIKLPPITTDLSIIIVSYKRLDYLRKCIRSIIDTVSQIRYEIIVVDNQSADGTADSICREFPSLRMIENTENLGFAKGNNLGILASNGEFILLLNNDTEAVSRDWLTELVGQVLRPTVGVAGGLLLFKDGSVQHAGIRPGLNGFMGHSHKHLPGDDPGYFGLLTVAHEVAAVTGACLAIQRSTWNELGGLDEQNLTVAYNDIDLCLKARARGLKVVMTPHALLYHHESISRGFDDDPESSRRLHRELAVMKERWGTLLGANPAYNPNLDLSGREFTLANHPRVHPPWKEPPLEPSETHN